MWATYWTDEANDWIAQRVGLPRLRHVPIAPLDPRYSLGGWKARQVVSWIGARPFVWLADEPDVAGVLGSVPGLGPHLVVEIDPADGLTGAHVGRARSQLEQLGVGRRYDRGPT